MASICRGKESWPELLGARGVVAERTIERENSNVNAIIVPPGTNVTDDYRCDRVWIWVDENGFVAQVPIIG
ncbi:hypothetical protein ACHQM5_005010 [Ranunculus cassubicifolius]